MEAVACFVLLLETKQAIK